MMLHVEHHDVKNASPCAGSASEKKTFMATPTLRPLLVVALAALLGAQAAPYAQSQALVLRNVTVIDGTGAAAGPVNPTSWGISVHSPLKSVV
jgi:hypothetical protein